MNYAIGIIFTHTGMPPNDIHNSILNCALETFFFFDLDAILNINHCAHESVKTRLPELRHTYQLNNKTKPKGGIEAILAFF